MALDNYVSIEGRLVAKPELRKTKNDVSVTSFTVAVNRPYRKDKETQADFVPCQAYRGTADFICKYFDKGSAIKLNGSIITGSYEKDGKKVYTFNIAVENVGFPIGGSRKDNATEGSQPTGNPAPSYANKEEPQQSQPSYDDFEEIVDDDDLPF